MNTVVSVMPAREELVAGTDGHAHYPTATRTLCGRDVVLPDGRKPPTCEECRRVARAFDEVDGSVPPCWRWKQRNLRHRWSTA